MKDIYFTKHTLKRIEERYGGFGEKNARRVIPRAEKFYTGGDGIGHYKVGRDVFLIKEDDKKMKVITYYHADI